MIRVIDGPCFTPRLCPRSRSCLCTCPLPCTRQRLMAEGRRTNDQRSGSVIHVTILYPAIHIDIRYLLSVVASFLFSISVARRNFLIFYFVRFLHPRFSFLFHSPSSVRVIAREIPTLRRDIFRSTRPRHVLQQPRTIPLSVSTIPNRNSPTVHPFVKRARSFRTTRSKVTQERDSCSRK